MEKKMQEVLFLEVWSVASTERITNLEHKLLAAICHILLFIIAPFVSASSRLSFQEIQDFVPEKNLVCFTVFEKCCENRSPVVTAVVYLTT